MDTKVGSSINSCCCEHLKIQIAASALTLLALAIITVLALIPGTGVTPSKTEMIVVYVADGIVGLALLTLLGRACCKKKQEVDTPPPLRRTHNADETTAEVHTPLQRARSAEEAPGEMHSPSPVQRARSADEAAAEVHTPLQRAHSANFSPPFPLRRTPNLMDLSFALHDHETTRVTASVQITPPGYSREEQKKSDSTSVGQAPPEVEPLTVCKCERQYALLIIGKMPIEEEFALFEIGGKIYVGFRKLEGKMLIHVNPHNSRETAVPHGDTQYVLYFHANKVYIKTNTIKGNPIDRELRRGDLPSIVNKRSL
ncbi:MAG: hypothetical protein ACKVOH_01560 [Chlamydiales bacterium]